MMNKKGKDKGNPENNRMLQDKTNEDFNKQKPLPGGPGLQRKQPSADSKVPKNIKGDNQKELVK